MSQKTPKKPARARPQTGLHHPASVYAKQVVRGRLREMCGHYEIAACERHLRDLERQKDPAFPYRFDATRADRILRWFGLCIQSRGVEAGKPIELQPWQVFELSCVYGWVQKDSGARRFKRTYCKRARGNFKSTQKSGQCLYHMCGDAIYPPYRPDLIRFERSPEVECAAVDRGQAMRVFGDAKEIAKASPEIERRLKIPRSNPVVNLTLGGYMRALSKDLKNKDSGAPSYYVVDEYHAHPTSDIYDIGLNSFGKRPQALLDVITTAGDDAQSKPCYREELYAKQVLDGSVSDETYFVYICEPDEGDNPHDRSTWYKANPCLRYPNEYAKYLLQQIEAEYTAAYGSGDAEKIRKFLTRRLCLWQTGAVNRYMDEKCMALARDAQVSRSEFYRLTKGAPCYCGFDLGKRIDLSGAAAVFLLPDGRVACRVHGFMPEGGAARHEHTDRVPYTEWSRHGYVTLTPGDVTDNSFVGDWIERGEKSEGWKVEHVGYDGHNATDLAIRLNEEHNRDDYCVEVFQSCVGQNLATKSFRELLLQGKIVLEESALLIWCLANAVEISNANGDIRLSKKHKDDSERIDPVAAMMDALQLAMLRKNNPTIADQIKAGQWSM